MRPFDFESFARRLNGDQTPKVWSLLVTVFGELAQQKQARISGSVLRHLSDVLTIKQEALRVALHRLRKDGWIDSERVGRNSVYFLTDLGREQSERASPRIYGARSAADQAWLVIWDSKPADIGGLRGSWVAANALVSPDPPVRDDAFVTPIAPDHPLPRWMTNRICDPDTVQTTKDFAIALDDLLGSLGQNASIGMLESVALRVLIVHNWRRIALKTPDLPDFMFPEGWEVPACRERVNRLLSRFPRYDLSDLEEKLAA